MRHFAKLFTYPATTLGSSLFLSSLNGEAVRRFGSKRYYFEKPNKSLTLRERGPPTLAGMSLAPDLQWWRNINMDVRNQSQCNGKEQLGETATATLNSQCRRRWEEQWDTGSSPKGAGGKIQGQLEDNSRALGRKRKARAWGCWITKRMVNGNSKPETVTIATVPYTPCRLYLRKKENSKFPELLPGTLCKSY